MAGSNLIYMYLLPDNHAFTSSDYVLPFAIIMVSVLLFASCMGIVNAFASNLSERKKQIGILRTVGATKRQIINAFGREAFILSVICAPISIGFSYFMVKGIVSLLGDAFVFIPNWWVLVLCGLFSIICVMLAAFIPLRRAAKISPIQSIRDIELIRKIKTRRIKSRMVYNTPKLLVGRSLTFHLLKQLLVSTILVITIVFSCYGFSYMNYMKDNYYQMGYDYKLNISDYNSRNLLNLSNENIGFTENDKQKIRSMPYIKEVNGCKGLKCFIQTATFTDYMKTILYCGRSQVYENMDVDKLQNITKDNIDKIIGSRYSDVYINIKQAYGYNSELFPSTITSYEPGVLQKLKNSLIDGEINMEKINSGEEIILYAPQKVAFVTNVIAGTTQSYGFAYNDGIKKDGDYAKVAGHDYKAGDSIDLSMIYGDKLEIEGNYDRDQHLNNWERRDKTVTIGAIVSEFPNGFSDENIYYEYNGINIITSTIGINTFCENKKYGGFHVSLLDECDDEIDKELTPMLQEIADSVAQGTVVSNYMIIKEENQYIKGMFICMLSMIILFLSISASIINNALSTRIRASRRELGTLRAVGASRQEIVSSYIRQLLSTFGWSYLIGFGFFGVSFGILSYVQKIKESTMELQLTVWPAIVISILLFAACSINLWIKIRKEMKHSIIDNIREL